MRCGDDGDGNRRGERRIWERESGRGEGKFGQEIGEDGVRRGRKRGDNVSSCIYGKIIAEEPRGRRRELVATC
jgi:hypothetical protein